MSKLEFFCGVGLGVMSELPRTDGRTETDTGVNQYQRASAADNYNTETLTELGIVHVNEAFVGRHDLRILGRLGKLGWIWIRFHRFLVALACRRC